MKNIKFNTNFNQPEIPKGQTFKMPSQTIQGETMSIQDLFKRAASQGHFPLQEHEVQYLDVENIDDINHMYKQGHDLVDIQAHADSIKELNTKMQAQLAKNKKDADIAAKELEKQAIIKAHNDELNDEKGKIESDKN